MTSGGAVSGSTVASELAAIEVVPVSTRVSQQVRNEVIFQFTGGGEPVRPARYRLAITVSESVPATVVDPLTAEIQIETVALDATYSVTPVGPQPVAAFTGTSMGRATLSRTLQRFANIRARRDAEDRAARVVAEQIYTQVASHFALPPPALAAK
jgi:LPS-assembly lipoprotein